MVENLAHKGWVFNVDDADVNCAHDFLDSCENCADDGNYAADRLSDEEFQKIDHRIQKLEYTIDMFDWGHAESGTPQEWRKLDKLENELEQLYKIKNKHLGITSDINNHPNVDKDIELRPQIDSRENWFADDEWEDEANVDDWDW